MSLGASLDDWASQRAAARAQSAQERQQVAEAREWFLAHQHAKMHEPIGKWPRPGYILKGPRRKQPTSAAEAERLTYQRIHQRTARAQKHTLAAAQSPSDLKLAQRAQRAAARAEVENAEDLASLRRWLEENSSNLELSSPLTT